MQIFNRRRNVQQQQTPQAAPHRLLLLKRIVEQLNGDAVTFVHQRRPGLNPIVAALLLIAFRQRAEAPDMQPALLDTVIGHRGERLLHFPLQRVL